MSKRSGLLALLSALSIGAAALAVPTETAQAAEPVYTSFFSDIAIGGYDPVAYFSQNKPVKGSKKYQTAYNGATWHFASTENLDLFTADPLRYAPQYGGYCAWAVSQGYTAKGNPKNWAIHDGKLYLNYDDDVQKDWNQDRKGFISLADQNWPKVLN